MTMFRPHRVAGRVRVHDVAHRADDVRLELAQPRASRGPGDRLPASHSRIADSWPSIQRANVVASAVSPNRNADARVIRSREHIRPEAARLGGRARAAGEESARPPSVLASGT